MDEPLPGLSLGIMVGVVKLRRKRCSSCRRVRILFKLVANGTQAIGVGRELCAGCAGFRDE